MPWRSQLSRTPSDSKLHTEQPSQPAITEINQWMRRIQPSRARTPLPSSDPGEPFVSVSNPTTPRKKTLRPKLSSYFSHYIPTASNTLKHERLGAEYVYADRPASLPSEALDSVGYCQPEPEILMESLMTTLMSDPFHSLDARENASLMMIFEAYRSLRDQNAALADKLQTEIDCRFAGEVEAESAEKLWQQEREEYKAEIKRLELLIVKGKRGLVDVIRARQDSALRRGKRAQTHGGENHQETMFEFLERTKIEDDEARMSQRALLRPRPVSPSQKMVALSHRFSMTSFHKGLPLQTVQSADEHMTLSQASHLEDHESIQVLVDIDVKEAQQGHSVETSRASSSTFSSFGDFLPDELEQNIAPPRLPANRLMIKGLQTPTAQKATTAREQQVGALGEEMHTWSGETTVTDSALLTKRNVRSMAQQNRPTPLRLFPARSFSFEVGRESISGQQDVMTNDAVQSVMSSPQLSMSPRLSKIPSPVFDLGSLARPRREDSSSSFLTALRHSSVSQSSKSNRSSSESGRKSSGGLKLTQEMDSLRMKQMAAIPGRTAEAASMRGTSGDALHEQALGRSSNGQGNDRAKWAQPGVHTELGIETKENELPDDACLTKQRLVGEGFL